MYGYFPCQSAGDDLIIYNPDTINTASPDELTRLTCPRQPYDDHLCLADYFASTESGKMDVVAFQVVTVGREATERFDRLQAAGDYSEGYSFMAWLFRRRRPPPIICMDISGASWASARSRANAIRGVIPPSPTWRTIRRCSNCCRLSKANSA